MAGKLADIQTAANRPVEDMKRLGFTEYESKVYIQLLKQSPATAYEIAKSTGVPRPNTYHALEALVQRGAVLPVSENPVRYIGAKPEGLFDAISRQTRSLCTSLAEELATLPQAESDQYVWTLRGEPAVHDRIDALIAASRTSIWIKASDDVLRRHTAALRAAAQRGVEALIVLFGFDAEEFRLADNWRVYIHEANGVRMGTADNLFTVAVDHAEMLTAAMHADFIGAHTRNQPIVTMAQSLIRHDYYMAEIFGRFGREIAAVFGPHLRDLRIACYSPDQIASFSTRTGLA